MGNFFKFKVGKPQFLLDYAKDLKQYLWTKRNYEAAREIVQSRNEQIAQKNWQGFVSQGKFDKRAFEKQLFDSLTEGMAVSTANPAAAAERNNNGRLSKKTASLVADAYQMAVGDFKRTGKDFHKLFTQYIAAGFVSRFGKTLSLEETKLKNRVLALLGLTAATAATGEVSNPLSSSELFDFNANQEPVDGFYLSYVNSKNNKEEILPVALSIDPRIKTEGYNRITFNEKFHAQLRDGGRQPLTMSHFFLKFTGNNRQWKHFVDLIKQAGLKEPFHLKLQRKPDQVFKATTVTLYEADGRTALPIEVEIEKKYLPGEARLVLLEDGQLAVLRPFSTTPVPITDAYIRLPKHQIKNLVQVLRNSPEIFPIEVLPTKNKAAILYRNQQMYNNSLGKTMGPIINQDLGISAASATSMMMVINYVIPGLASFLNPVLQRMGEKRLSVLAGFITSLSNFLPPLAGFYGLAHDHSVGWIASAVIISAFVLRSIASVLQQVTSNMLVAANNGRLKEAKKLIVTHKDSQGKEDVSWQDVRARAKAVWKEKTSSEKIRNLLMYNLSFVYKNLGTLLFLALPWVLNKLIFLFSGYDAHLVYSISFPIFGVYALLVTLQTLRTNLRDAYSVPTVAKSRMAAEQMVSEIADAVQGAVADPKTTPSEMNVLLELGAQKLIERVENLIEAHRQEKTPKKQWAGIRAQALEELEQKVQMAIIQQVPGEQGKALAAEFVSALHHTEHNPTTPWQVFLHAPKVAAITLAMTLATVHEFTISSAFAMNLNQLISNGDTANLLVAVALYVPLIIGRLGGNLMASRISSGTMYLLCNTLSGLGTLIMLSSGGNVGVAILGAAITSLGVGNYFSQMYDYVTKKNPKLQRQISVLLAVTMALAGLLTTPASHLNAWLGGSNLDIWYSLVCLVGSWLLTTCMMKDSTIIRYFKSLWKNRHGKTTGTVSEAADQQTEPPADTPQGPDMNNPLLN